MRGDHMLEVLAHVDLGQGVAELLKMAMPVCWADVKGYLYWSERPVAEVPVAKAANTGIDQLHYPFPLY